MRLTTEQRGFVDTIRAFCAKECGTAEQRADLTDGGTLADSPTLLRRLAEQGWLGISLPAEHGGQGGTFVDECLFLEATARGLAPVTAYGTGLTAAQTYLHWGTDDQKRTIVASICAGNFEAIALSEPEAGSDLASARMRAEAVGDEFVLDGQKTWTTAAHLATHVLVLARTDASRGKHEGLTLFMLPADAPGLEIRGIDTMYGRTVNDLYFTGVRVPVAAVVGTVGGAWRQLNRGLGVERLIIAASSVGAAQRSSDDLLAYVKQREQFGRPIGSFQAVRHRIADLATEIALCRTFLYDVADRLDAGDEGELSRDSSTAKIRCTEAAKNTALEAVQLMGGYGYAREYGMEVQVRKALAPPIYGGTNEIQREIISRSLGL